MIFSTRSSSSSIAFHSASLAEALSRQLQDEQAILREAMLATRPTRQQLLSVQRDAGHPEAFVPEPSWEYHPWHFRLPSRFLKAFFGARPVPLEVMTWIASCRQQAGIEPLWEGYVD